ncbi:MAG: sigma-70 family RNA polymerase sigma factor [Candidatus Eisenbacteria bacterium]|uniref:Sigma-70 family RNA polymerase sigma factor n=1 Tax=Eiseniibacteriota bacterium TaxID=2212470 RepID=A0A937XDQ9_UNCEI|nr:sigma-70 family RNA polymerase sigma factor [Candidatus Eisenbacteria bacterium]
MSHSRSGLSFPADDIEAPFFDDGDPDRCPAAPDRSRLPHPGAIPWGAVEDLRPVWVRRATRAGIDREDAEDLFQESLLAALEGIERLRIPEERSFADAFLAWFWGILRHKQISELRRRRRVRPLGAGPLEADAGRGLARGREALATQVRTSLGLLARSAPAEAQVLSERFLQGRELRELAASLDVSVPTACRRVQAALARLRGCAALVLS